MPLPAPDRPVPTATYRLQLHAGFGFAAAADLAGYLADLGVSHLYLSPVLEAVPGSMHGYDVVRHEISPALGGEDGLRRLADAARRHGLGLVVDVVPNHMAVPAPESLNAPLWDVLRRGTSSAYASWFDVDWSQHEGRLLMPVLGAPLDRVLADAEIALADPGGEVLGYYEHRFPVAEPRPGQPVDKLVEDQHYRLADWRLANDELNYRRFFDVTSLIAVRVEEPDVWAATHEALLRQVRAGIVDGLRIDHPDGLADPAGYLDRLAEATSGAWVVVEKILEPGESLPERWRCAGTTGYDALTELTGVLTDPAGEALLTAQYEELTGSADRYAAVVLQAKRDVVGRLLRAEVGRLARNLWATEPAGSADVSGPGVVDAITELLVHFPVYRAYTDDPEGRDRLAAAAAAATSARPERTREIAIVAAAALGDSEFAVRFGQTTGPVMAKGVEDTAFYRYPRLSALNDVGGDPGRFGVTVGDFHSFCTQRSVHWPVGMNALSTHDTKRSEDVRARLVVLAELPGDWADALRGWRQATASLRSGDGWPDPGLELLFWQTLVGAWPITAQRIQAYMHKAAREAKRWTSWTDPNEAYEQAVRRFVDGVYADDTVLDAVRRFVDRIAVPGRRNALSQKVLQLTMPGVPDVYQGCELWDHSLVDPDNRRPVDWAARRQLLAAGGPPPDPADDDDGATKLWVVSRLLRLRRERPESFGPAAGYHPLDVTGPAAAHAIAFRRGEDVAVVATRLPVGLDEAGGWGGTRLDLPPGRWRDALSTSAGPASLELGALLTTLPATVLVGDA